MKFGKGSGFFHPLYRPDIDGLRAIAVLAVVAFHAFPQRLAGGFAGVDVFFVISGFLITTIIMKSLVAGSFSFRVFYGRRIRRIFPALLLVLAASLVFGWFVLLADEYRMLGKHVLAGAGFVSNIAFFQESGYFDVAAETKPLLHLWSLGVEEQFYIIWPLILWFGWRFTKTALPVLLVALVLSFVAGLLSLERDSSAAFYLPHNRFWELLAGAGLAWFVIHKEHGLVFSRLRLRLNDCMSVIGVGLIGFSLLFASKDNFPGWWACLPVLGTVLVILAGQDALINRVLLSRRIMVWVGLISFPLYLWHWPVLSFARILEGEVPSRNIRIVAVLISIFLAWLTYVLLEKPLRNHFSDKSKTVALVTIMLCIGGAGGAIYALGGIPQRSVLKEMQAVQAELDFKLDRSAGWICDEYRASSCVYSGEPNGVVIGDSHGARLFYGLRSLYAEVGVNLASFGGRGGCLPFYNLASKPGLGADKLKCQESVSSSIDKVISMPDIKNVIIVNRGPLYTTRHGFGGFDGDHFTHWSIAVGGNFDKSPDNSSIYQAALEKTLSIFIAAGKDVTYVHNVPELGFDIRSCIDSRPFRLSSKVRFPCAVSKEAFIKRNAGHRRLVDEVLSKFPQVKQLDPALVLCDERYCYGMKDGKPLYSDDDHLSKFGSSFVAEGMRNQLR